MIPTQEQLDSYARDLANDALLISKGLFTRSNCGMQKHRLGASLIRLYQEEKLTLEAAMDMVDITEGPGRQTSVMLALPVNASTDTIVKQFEKENYTIEDDANGTITLRSPLRLTSANL